jgi:hypothetical protein
LANAREGFNSVLVVSPFKLHPLYPPLQTADRRMPLILLFGEGDEIRKRG